MCYSWSLFVFEFVLLDGGYLQFRSNVHGQFYTRKNQRSFFIDKHITSLILLHTLNGGVVCKGTVDIEFITLEFSSFVFREIYIKVTITIS